MTARTRQVAGLEAEAESWGQNKKTLVREAESYEVQLTDILLVRPNCQYITCIIFRPTVNI